MGSRDQYMAAARRRAGGGDRGDAHAATALGGGHAPVAAAARADPADDGGEFCDVYGMLAERSGHRRLPVVGRANGRGAYRGERAGVDLRFRTVFLRAVVD